MNATNPSEPVTASSGRQLFSIGDLVATPGALALLTALGIEPLTLVGRHALGDWGDICAEDADANRDALASGDRLLSAYRFGVDKVWVITEADRSVTTLLLPSEY